MTKAERNDAIVKMYRGGYTQEAIGIDRTFVSKVAGAKERTERIVNNSHSKIRVVGAKERTKRIMRNAYSEIRNGLLRRNLTSD